MAVKIENRTNGYLVPPSVDGPPLKPREARIYEYVEYDALVNSREFMRAVTDKRLRLFNMDDMDVNYVSEWDKTPKLELGDYNIWIDSTGAPRLKDGIPTGDTDGYLFGGGGGEALQSVHSDVSTSMGWTFAQLRSQFFNWTTVYNRNIGTWDSVFKYGYWSFWWPGSPGWSTPVQFATQDDLFTWLEANVPSSGGSYTSIFKFNVYDVVDTTDVFPKELNHRNSLVASILGRGLWTNRTASDRYGVSFNFNSPSYYLNFFGELARRFVQADLGVLPPNNNDGAVWHTNRKRTNWSFPKVGQIVDINAAPGLRGAVWDNGTGSWVTPAPQSSYVIDNPMMLYEYRKNRLLNLDPNADVLWRRWAVNAVSALVFPVYNSGNPNQRAYILYPHGTDMFTTEYFDLGQYELSLKLGYRGTYSPVYLSLPTPHQNNDSEHFLWSIFPSGGGTSLLLQRQYGGSQYAASVDNSAFPDNVWVARRNKVTGARSPWYKLYTIRRRIPHASFRVEPARPRV